VTARQELIHELSTPTLRVGERLLVMPLIGRLDAARAEHLTSRLLDDIRQSRAQVVILDLTGVPAIDSPIANHVLETVEAARLMGARVIVTGLNAEAAATLADLNVDFGTLTTIGDLQDGIQEGQRILRQRQTGSISAL
jgi:rsbT co-antagonist protein RsbR